jgi:hypothetical protein
MEVLFPAVFSPSRPEEEKAASSQPYLRLNCDGVSMAGQRELGSQRGRESGEEADLVGVVEVLIDHGFDISVIAPQRLGDHVAVLEASDHDHHLDLLVGHSSPAVGHLDCPAPAVVGPSEDVKGGESEADRMPSRKALKQTTADD